MHYAQVLQMNGNTDQSLAVMRKLAIAYPKDRDVLAAYGKALAGVGQLEPALDAVRRAQTPEYPDWKLLSAEAAILDQLGQSGEARADLSQGAGSEAERSVDPFQSRHVLCADRRSARPPKPTCAPPSQQPGADSRVRQNLALVVGLQGRFDEAEQIASQELSPDQAQGQRRLSARHAGAAECLEPAEGQKTRKQNERSPPTELSLAATRSTERPRRSTRPFSYR